MNPPAVAAGPFPVELASPCPRCRSRIARAAANHGHYCPHDRLCEAGTTCLACENAGGVNDALPPPCACQGCRTASGLNERDTLVPPPPSNGPTIEEVIAAARAQPPPTNVVPFVRPSPTLSASAVADFSVAAAVAVGRMSPSDQRVVQAASDGYNALVSCSHEHVVGMVADPSYNLRCTDCGAVCMFEATLSHEMSRPPVWVLPRFVDELAKLTR